MSGQFVRLTREGACNEPQPWNWRDACRRRPGHSGDHHAFDGKRPPQYVFAWPGPTGPVRHIRGLRTVRAYQP